MSLNPVDRAVLDYLKRKPYSKPREIAEGLGFSLTSVRIALYRLRERGLVVRTSKGYTARTTSSISSSDASNTEILGTVVLREDLLRSFSDLRDRVSELEKSFQDLMDVVGRLEREVGELRLMLRSIQEILRTNTRKSISDPLLSRLMTEKILSISEARRYASEGLGTLDRYIESGAAVIVGKFVVSRDLYDLVISQMPINVEKLNSMSAKEKILIETLINEGYAYIDGEHMIRLIES
ncbi:MAG: helix-turn-helix domain-containing protein [Sulfolobales archaeon]